MARRVLQHPADRLVRDNFKLRGWVLKPAQRRRTYFGFCDFLVTTFGSLVSDGDPSDASVMIAIGGALREDDSFTAHVAKKDAAMLTKPENWDQIYQAGSGTILHEYLVALEKHDWPEGEGA
jgi:hypothetical protein